ncbi:MAG: DUF1015 domain-containing protein [Alphaproteobacteria bacterium]|nr:DUF1015 domain-containing protein [Alphaproteobacteria bacterium]MBF0251209.1 DUF1015 domain-containing protein [Alphaproteobacteria bacterium]
MADETVLPLLRPFAALRPAEGRAGEVAAPPYDVMSTPEARDMAQGKPWSFLHVSRAEIDLDDGADPYSATVYAKASENLDKMIEAGVLVRDETPRYYVYRAIMGGHVQTGIAAGASVRAYEENRIKKHELTRPAKEDDRVRQIEAVKAQTGPVFLTYRANPELKAIYGRVTAETPLLDADHGDGVRHQVWSIADAETVSRIQEIFTGMDALYVADGHHRSAAAVRIAHKRRGGGASADASHESFLSVSFPDDEMLILDYNRVVRDLNGLDAEGFLARLREDFEVIPADIPVAPEHPASFGLYLDGSWHVLVLKTPPGPDADPVARLDVSLLMDHVLVPILGIKDPRTDDRIDFVGGARGLKGLARRVDGGEWACAFSMFPTSLADLMAVADAGQIMPPKSTWFEPKLADGMLSLVLD